MFVTCLYAVLDTTTGRLEFANAGHDLPYRSGAGGVDELRATGMPLGLMPGMTYEIKEIVLAPGDRLLFYSDGLVEAHSPTGDMFGFPRLRDMLGIAPAYVAGAERDTLVGYLLDQLAEFTGPGWDQEDDVTLVILERAAAQAAGAALQTAQLASESQRRALAEFTLSSEPGNERLAMLQVAEAVASFDLPPARLERLKTAVAEATMNAMEHGNQYRPDLPVAIEVAVTAAEVVVRITDHGGGRPIGEREAPDLDAKLAGTQSPRGWGLFLIKNMVDEMNIIADEAHHTVELIMRLAGPAAPGEGGNHGDPAV
jgi:anti-sigma regulatory factor (Ser/Thr protein kinase)